MAARAALGLSAAARVVRRPLAAAVVASGAARASRRLTATTAVGPVPAFDKYRVVQRLEEHGLNRKQAEAISVVLNEVIRESVELAAGTDHQVCWQFCDHSLSVYSQQVVTKAEQEKTVYMYKADFAELKSELHMLEKNDFAILKGENERLEAELDKVRAQMREDINRLHGSVRLDMNLEKGRLRDEALVQESKIKDTENRIDTEISNIRTQLETLKFDIIKYIVGSIASASALFLGYWRLVKSGG